MDLQTTGAHRKYADRAITFVQEDLDANGHLKALGILRLFQNSDLWFTFRLIKLEIDLTGDEPKVETFKCREIEGLKGLIGRTPEFTLMDGSNKVIQCPERYLETALPKVGGNAICLAGNYRYGKGKLLERDSKSSKGVIQLYEDMNVVKLSLDDMAEYCGPLDDDLME